MRRVAVLVVALTILAACGKAPTALQTSPPPSPHSRGASPSAASTSDSSPDATPGASPGPTDSPAATPPAATPPADPSAPCTSVSLDVSPPSPQLIGAVVTLTATASGCANPEFRFWLITPNPPGVGLVVQAWYAQDTFMWKTADWAGTGNYGLRVDARHAGATSDSEEATTSQDFVLNPVTAGPACATVTIAASQAQSQPAGSSFAFTATADGCPSPEFQWWLTDPNGVGLLVQSWSSTASYTATTSVNSPLGDYSIKAEARQAGDTPVEASGTQAFTVTAGPPPSPLLDCTTITVTVSPESPQLVDTPITWTAESDCQNALYDFWINPPPGAMPQSSGWTTSNTFTATSTGRDGTYNVAVLAQDPDDGRSTAWYSTFTFTYT
jgi:hypothetical protein